MNFRKILGGKNPLKEIETVLRSGNLELKSFIQTSVKGGVSHHEQWKIGLVLLVEKGGLVGLLDRLVPLAAGHHRVE